MTKTDLTWSRIARKLAAVVVALAVVTSMIGAGIHFGVVDEDAAPVGIAEAATTVIDDFEDGDTTVKSGNWSGWSQTQGSSFTTTSTNAIDGTNSGIVTASGTAERVVATRSSNVSASSISMKIRVNDTMTSQQGAQIQVWSGSTIMATISLDENRAVNVSYSSSNTDSGANYQAGDAVPISMRNIDYANDQYDLYVYGVYTGTYSFRNSVSGIDEVRANAFENSGSDTFEMRFDTVELNNSGFSSISTDGVADNFEDGTLTNPTSDGYLDWQTNGNLSVNSASPINGSYDGQVVSDNDAKEGELISKVAISPTKVTAKVNIGNKTNGNDNSGTDESVLQLKDGSTIITSVVFKDDPAGNITAKDGGTGPSSDAELVANWSADTTYRVTFTQLDWSNNTYHVNIDGTSYGPFSFVSGSSEIDRLLYRTDSRGSDSRRNIYIDDIGANTSLDASGGGAGSGISGTVVDQAGNPVPNATVVGYVSEVSTQAAARDALQNYSTPRPPEWLDQNKSDLKLTGEGGEFTKLDSYVATHDREALQETAPWIDTADLGDPRLRMPANEPIIVSAWDGTASGFRASFGEYDGDLPGAHKQDATIVIERLDGRGDVVSRSTVSLDERTESGFADPTQFHYTTVELQPGFYRLYEQGAANKGPIRLVGSPASFIQKGIQNVNDSLSDQAQSVKDALDAGDLSRLVTTTDANGKYSLSPPSQAKLVTVQAMKAPGVNKSPSNLDIKTINDDYNAALKDKLDANTTLSSTQKDLLNSSVYLPTSTKTVDPPKSGVTIEVTELSAPPLANLTGQQELLEDLRDQLLNETFSQLPGALQQRLDGVSREQLENVYDDLDRLRERNERLESRYDQLLDEYLSEDAEVGVDPDDTSTDELQARIRALKQSMTELRSTIEAGESSVSTSGDTVTYRQRFDAPLNPADISVIAHWSNGTSEVVGDEYIAVDNDLENVAGAGGSAVIVEEYPVGDSDPAALQFEIRGASDEGIAKAQEQVKNPTFSGELPSLQSISLSTLEPGPNQDVTLRVNPGPQSNIESLSSVTVYGPDGNQVTTGNITDESEVNFSTAGSGIHHVQATMIDANGNQFQTTFRVTAGETDSARPASVRAKDSPLGVYALVGSGLSGGDVKVENGGSKTTVVAQTPTDGEVPNRVHVYLESLSLSEESDTIVRIVRGEQEEAISKHVPLTVHLPRLPEDGQVWRNDDPLPEDGTKWGQTTRSSGSTAVETFTDGDGSVVITTQGDPSLFEEAQFFAQVQAARLGVDAPFLTVSAGALTPASDGTSPAPAILTDGTVLTASTALVPVAVRSSATTTAAATTPTDAPHGGLISA